MQDSIPMLRPGETAGPFEIVIPREVVFYALFLRRTSRWERMALRLRVFGRKRRLLIWERFRPELEQWGDLPELVDEHREAQQWRE